jgi:hypothetical protein
VMFGTDFPVLESSSVAARKMTPSVGGGVEHAVDDDTVNSLGAGPPREGGQQARFAVRRLRFGDARNAKGISRKR